MAMETPEGAHAHPRRLDQLAAVTLLAASGYSAHERARDLSSAEGWSLALVQSPYALAKLRDGRYLAVRAARDSRMGLVELGLSYSADPPDDDDDESWVAVVAVETLSSLAADNITQLWLGFFEGTAETAAGVCRTFGPDGGSPELGIRHVAVGTEATASSSRSRVSRKQVSQWIEEVKWQPFLAARAPRDELEGREEASDAGDRPAPKEPMLFPMSKLQTLRQVLQLLGLLGKHARQWDAAQAAGFLEAALGAAPPGSRRSPQLPSG